MKSNIALTRYLIVVVVFVILGLVVLLSKREVMRAQAQSGVRGRRHFSYDTGHEHETQPQQQQPQEEQPHAQHEQRQDDNSNNEGPEDLDCDAGVYDNFRVDSGDFDDRGNLVGLAKYRGRVSLIVNVASKCGFTDRGYSAATELWHELGGADHNAGSFAILAFPSEDFPGPGPNSQEPDPVSQIRMFAKGKFDADFPIFGKTRVRGPKISPLFRHLTKCAPPKPGEPVRWNWTFFLVDRMGVVKQRFPPGTPAEKMRPAIQELLQA